MSDPKVIYLGPECEDEFCDGRTWADHVAWPDCDCKHKPVRYNLGSDRDAALAREAALGEEMYRFKRLRSSFLNRVLCERDALQQRLTDAKQKLGEAYEWGYTDGQNCPNGYSDKEDRDKCIAELLKPVEGEGS